MIRDAHGPQQRAGARSAEGGLSSPATYVAIRDWDVTGIVVNLSAAVSRRVATLELEVAHCLQAVSQAPPTSWRRKLHIAELIEAERRLSIAEGMRRDE